MDNSDSPIGSDSDLKMEFDADGDPYEECFFFEEYLDQTACGDGTGSCRIADTDGALIQCPARGPRGANLCIPPTNCPLLTHKRVIISRFRLASEPGKKE